MLSRFITKVGQAVAWLSLVIVVVICLDVITRYAFNSSKVWLIELEWMLFGFLFLFAGSWCWLENRHVSVDVWYGRASKKSKSKIDLIGHLILALPWIVVVLYATWEYAMYSWKLNEGSPDPGGLPGRYIIKFGVFVAFVFMLLTLFIKVRRTIREHIE